MNYYPLSTTTESNQAIQCLGGRFRQISDYTYIIQCNCPFLCSSMNKVYTAKYKRIFIPYYYGKEMNIDEIMNPKCVYNLRSSSASKK